MTFFSDCTFVFPKGMVDGVKKTRRLVDKRGATVLDEAKEGMRDLYIVVTDNKYEDNAKSLAKEFKNFFIISADWIDACEKEMGFLPFDKYVLHAPDSMRNFTADDDSAILQYVNACVSMGHLEDSEDVYRSAVEEHGFLLRRFPWQKVRERYMELKYKPKKEKKTSSQKSATSASQEKPKQEEKPKPQSSGKKSPAKPAAPAQPSATKGKSPAKSSQPTAEKVSVWAGQSNTLYTPDENKKLRTFVLDKMEEGFTSLTAILTLALQEKLLPGRTVQSMRKHYVTATKRAQAIASGDVFEKPRDKDWSPTEDLILLNFEKFMDAKHGAWEKEEDGVEVGVGRNMRCRVAEKAGILPNRSWEQIKNRMKTLHRASYAEKLKVLQKRASKESELKSELVGAGLIAANTKKEELLVALARNPEWLGYDREKLLKRKADLTEKVHKLKRVKEEEEEEEEEVKEEEKKEQKVTSKKEKKRPREEEEEDKVKPPPKKAKKGGANKALEEKEQQIKRLAKIVDNNRDIAEDALFYSSGIEKNAETFLRLFKKLKGAITEDSFDECPGVFNPRLDRRLKAGKRVDPRSKAEAAIREKFLKEAGEWAD